MIIMKTSSTVGDMVSDNIDNKQFLDSELHISGIIQQWVLFNLVNTMVNAADRYSLGHLLLIGYTSKDAVASWCSTTLLAHLIADNPKPKEKLLNVISAVDQSPTGTKTLMEMSIDLLKNPSSSFNSRIVVLIYLSTWLLHFALAVQQFVLIPSTISYFISQIRNPSSENDREAPMSSLHAFVLELMCFFPSERLKQLINKEIGAGVFKEKLDMIQQSTSFINASKNRSLTFNDMTFDYAFTRLYHYSCGLIKKLF
ncbi:unnamed protein product [Rotaria sp. Silwood1]|nr:unnamed protein product [Rotaria sp. Silwood1]CAF1494251.1 unnamed protein product [Rotaria sp. Silwood1]